ncbi:MAG: hypothetical protein ABMA64_27460, partial [Myxococcota bacterium]
MTRMWGAGWVLLGFTCWSAPAMAADSGPYMWGAGVKVGTSFLPGRYPYALPPAIAGYDFLENGPRAGETEGENKDRDLDDNGDPRFTTLNPVGFDLRLGGEGFYGIDAQNRIGAGAGLAFGQRYFDGWLTVNYDRVLYEVDNFDFVLGGQVGYGSVKWSGDAELPGGDNESLKMNYYPIRARASAQFLDKTRMYGLGVFVQDAIPARTNYTDLDANPQDVGGNLLFNFMAGIEADVQFGDFKAPKKDGGKKGGKKGADEKKGGGDKGGQGGGGQDGRTDRGAGSGPDGGDAGAGERERVPEGGQKPGPKGD